MTNNYDGTWKYKQENGDIAVLFPKTKVANVAGAATAESVATLSNRVDSLNDLGNIPNRLPYTFEGVSVVFGAYPGMDINTVSGYASLPWIHTRNHKLTGSIESPYNFYIVNLTNGSVQIVNSGATVNITAQADSTSNITVRFIVPANLNVLTPYLVYSSKLSITISNS